MEQSKILIYQTDDGQTQIDVRLENDTVWLNTKQMSSLFDREESNIRRHILGVFKEGELVRKNNVHFLHVNGVKKPVPFYNLDVIISVGYRVKSKRGIDFRIWARGVLKDFLIIFGPPFSCTRRRGRIDLLLVRHSEVVRTGLRLLEDQEQRIAALRTAIEEGMTSGCVEDFDSKVLNNFLELS